MTVIANDFVPVHAYTTHSLFLAVGARYDVTIDASMPVGKYWMNATLSGTRACGRSENLYPAAILSYVGAEDGMPEDPGEKPADSLCADQTDFVPVVERTVPREDFLDQGAGELGVTLSVDAERSKVFWKVNGSAIDVSWEEPTLEFVRRGEQGFGAAGGNVVTIPKESEVSFFSLS